MTHLALTKAGNGEQTRLMHLNQIRWLTIEFNCDGNHQGALVQVVFDVFTFSVQLYLHLRFPLRLLGKYFSRTRRFK